MRIENIIPPDNIVPQSQSAVKPAAVTGEKLGETPEKEGVPAVGDQADVSKISALLAKANKEAENDTAVRQEKLDAMREIVNKPVDFSDDQIDLIIQRLLQN